MGMAAACPGSRLFSIHGQSFFGLPERLYSLRVLCRDKAPSALWSWVLLKHTMLHELHCPVRWFAQGVTAACSGLSSHCYLPPSEENWTWFSPMALTFSHLSACRHWKALGVVFILEERELRRYENLLQPSKDHHHRPRSLLVYSLMGRIHSPKKVTNKPKEWTSQIQLKSPILRAGIGLFGLYWPDPIWTSLFSQWSGAETEGNCFKLLFSFIFFSLSCRPLKFHRHLNLITTSSVQCKV